MRLGQQGAFGCGGCLIQFHDLPGRFDVINDLIRNPVAMPFRDHEHEQFCRVTDLLFEVFLDQLCVRGAFFPVLGT